MKWIEKCRQWLLNKTRRNDPAEDGDRFVRRERARFCMAYRAVYEACAQLEPETGINPVEMTRRYMDCVLKTNGEEEWWRENGEHTTKPWFIGEYGRQHALIPPRCDTEAPRFYILRPQTQEHEGTVEIRLERSRRAAEEGVVQMTYQPEDGAFAGHMRERQYRKKEEGVYIRRVSEHAAPIEERAAEHAAALLDCGYAVCVQEGSLRERILNRCFTPEHRYWILPAAQADRLQLVYPRDVRLHQYVCRAGGRWTGKRMEISICHTDRVEEMMQIYGFRATREARARMDAWQEAIARTTIYHQRQARKNAQKPQDMFQAMLERPRNVIDDLRETWNSDE